MCSPATDTPVYFKVTKTGTGFRNQALEQRQMQWMARPDSMNPALSSEPMRACGCGSRTAITRHADPKLYLWSWFTPTKYLAHKCSIVLDFRPSFLVKALQMRFGIAGRSPDRHGGKLLLLHFREHERGGAESTLLNMAHWTWIFMWRFA